jgi:hypothetical protein
MRKQRTKTGKICGNNFHRLPTLQIEDERPGGDEIHRMKEYKKRLFDSYSSTHDKFLQPDVEIKKKWFKEYVRKNYLSLLWHNCNFDSILEIGCGRGFLLNALSELGFQSL